MIIWGDMIVWGDNVSTNKPAWGQMIVWGDTGSGKSSTAWKNLAEE